MADNFERHRSTRWVKADVPSYGDEWGSEYDEYDQNPHESGGFEANDATPSRGNAAAISGESLPPLPYHLEQHAPQIGLEKPEHLVSNSTLVLSIDKSNFAHNDGGSEDTEDDDSSEEELVQSNSAKYTDFDANIAEDPSVSRPQSKSVTSDNSAAAETDFARRNTPTESVFLPPTPTYQTHPRFPPASPDTDVSDRSYLSDTDSIQREPANLNVRAPAAQLGDNPSFIPRVVSNASFTNTNSNSVSEPRVFEDLSSASMSTGEKSFSEPSGHRKSPPPPEALVLSIDRLNLNDSDDSSFDDYHPETHGNESLADKRNSGSSYASHPHSVNDDDWGYNSGHSSNFESDERHSIQELHLQKTASQHTPRHRVQTDALDSLIDDLSRMEGDSALFEGNSASTLKPPQPPTASGSSNYHTPHETKGFLPSLDSIRDMQLPDFANHSFSDGENSDSVNIVPPSSGDHEKFVSSVRQDSVRKPPPLPSLDQEIEERVGAVESKGTEEAREPEDFELRTPALDQSRSTDEPNGTSACTLSSTESEACDASASCSSQIPQNSETESVPPTSHKAIDSAPPPIAKDADDVGRRGSTISNSTFHLGAWKPNTSLYREKFVNDNDNESHINVSIYNKDDSAYKKFTRTGAAQNYAPSISNSSCVSVPDTVDTSLQQINEGDSDEGYPDTMSVAKSYQPVTPAGSSNPSLGSSVLHDHIYERAKFIEETHTPGDSSENLAPIHEETETRLTSTGSSSTIKTSTMAGPDSQGIPSAKVKYPVFNWKNIMAVSQPVDRIQLLKKARSDEMNYDTGLSSWLRESLKSTESPHIQIGQLATQAYKNAQHSDVRRHTSIRSKVNLVRDKMETGNLGLQATSLGRKFFSRGKKLIKPGAD
ncbi:hypothetical protein OXX59_001410 [Metschnikowia pulcherrima]